MIKAIAKNYLGHSFKAGVRFSGFATQNVKVGLVSFPLCLSLRHAGIRSKANFSLCKTIELLETFLTCAPNGSWMHTPEGYTLSYFAILSPELSDLMAAQ